MENNEELKVTEAEVSEAVEETKAQETVEVAEEKPAKGRKGRGRKQKIETTEEKPQSDWTETVVQISRHWLLFGVFIQIKVSPFK
jgi:hypothetical protein